MRGEVINDGDAKAKELWRVGSYKGIKHGCGAGKIKKAVSEMLRSSLGRLARAVCMYVCGANAKSCLSGNGGYLSVKFCRSADKSYAVGSLLWRWGLPSSLDLLKFGA